MVLGTSEEGLHVTTVFDRWQEHRAAVTGKRFVHFTLNHDPYEDYQRVVAHLASYPQPPRQAVKLTPYDYHRMTDLVHHEGFTHQPHTDESPSQGFSASLHKSHGAPTEMIHAGLIAPRHIADHRAAAGKLLHADPQLHQGGWWDTKTRHVYLDVSHVEHDESKVRQFGLHHRQLAYYDLGKGESVYFDPHRDPEKTTHPANWNRKYAEKQQHFGGVPAAWHGYSHEYDEPAKEAPQEKDLSGLADSDRRRMWSRTTNPSQSPHHGEPYPGAATAARYAGRTHAPGGL